MPLGGGWDAYRPGKGSLRRRLRDSFSEFFRLEASGGILLMICVVIAMILANSPFAASFSAFWQQKLIVGFGSLEIDKPLILWINDGLMAIFFLVVGLEIKRELLVGELANMRRAMLPIAAAVGGMVVPAGIYAALNAGSPAIRGWGVPMATDIAFSLGVLALLGSRAPFALKIFLAALAIVDDLGAVLVIAIFYTEEIKWVMLGWGGAFFMGLLALNKFAVRSKLGYVLFGIALWVCFLKSGVHATIAGVLIALTVPTRVRINAKAFEERVEGELGAFRLSSSTKEDALLNEVQQTHVHAIERTCEDVQMPLERLMHDLHPWQTYFIVPVFALANAGVALEPGLLSSITTPLPLGIMLGLVVGKPVGIMLFSWLAVKAKLCALPRGIKWSQIFGASCLAGIGFTMSLFIAELAFKDADQLNLAKVGILIASVVAAVIGFGLLSRITPSPERIE